MAGLRSRKQVVVTLAVAAGALAAVVCGGTASAAGNSCSAVGLTKAVAVKAYGTGADISPQGAVCDVSSPSDTSGFAASVIAYSPSEWSGLIQSALISTPKPKRYAVHGFGPKAALFTSIAPAVNLKEQDLYFATKSTVIHIQTAGYTGNARSAPNPALAKLAHAVYAHLG